MPTSLRLYNAVVTSTTDPEGRNRVLARFASSGRTNGKAVEAWVHAAPSGGGGLRLEPQYNIGDEVLVAADRIPSNKAVIVSCLRVAAPASPAHSVLDLPNGQQLRLQTSQAELELSVGSGASITFATDGSVTVKGTTVKVQAARVVLSGSQVTVESGLSTFTGAVQCDTMIAHSVVAASYTPGAGNLRSRGELDNDQAHDDASKT